LLRRTLRTLSILFFGLIGTLASSGVAYAKECSAFGCHAGQGNPIEELAGMIVLCGAIAVLLFGVSRRYVK
jgi:hypothetical protein